MASASQTIVLITGANIGIGYATAKLLTQLSSSYHVILCSRDLSKGKAALAEIRALPDIKGTLSLLQLEVTSDESVTAAVATVEKDFGRVDVLINNAGTGAWESTAVLEKCKVSFETNALGAVRVTEAFKPLVLASKIGRIIFVSSGQGSISKLLDPANPWKQMRGVSYRMSKAAMNMAAAEYMLELQGKAKVFVMCPGFVHTNLRRDAEPRPGALPAETSAETLRSIIEGERDEDMQKLIAKEGIYAW